MLFLVDFQLGVAEFFGFCLAFDFARGERRLKLPGVEFAPQSACVGSGRGFCAIGGQLLIMWVLHSDALPSSLYSSVVERQSCKLKVLGSIPSGGCMHCTRKCVPALPKLRHRSVALPLSYAPMISDAASRLDNLQKLLVVGSIPSGVARFACSALSVCKRFFAALAGAAKRWHRKGGHTRSRTGHLLICGQLLYR